MFLFIGLLVGREGPGRFEFPYYALAQTLGILALIFILHAGGLDTALDDVRPVVALVVLTYGVTDGVGDSGFLAVYVSGIVLSNSDYVNKTQPHAVPRRPRVTDALPPRATHGVVGLRLPMGALVVWIRRNDDVFVPRGNTQIASDDVLLLLAERDAIDRTRAIVNARAADAT